MKKINFIVNLWNKEYIAEFFKVCFRTINSEKNIQYLHKKNFDVTLLIITLENDYNLINDKIKNINNKFFNIKIIKLTDIKKNESVYDIMNKGYKLGIQYSINQKSSFSILTSDSIYSDGIGVTLDNFFNSKDDILLAPALRYSRRKLFKNLGKNGIHVEESLNDSLSVSSEILSRVAIKSMHEESKISNFNSKSFAINAAGIPLTCWWRIPNSNGIEINTSSWIILCVKYDKNQNFKLNILDNYSIDTEFIFKNYKYESIQVIKDSIHGIVTSYSDEKFHYFNTYKILKFSSKFQNFYKVAILKNAIKNIKSESVKYNLFFDQVYINNDSRNNTNNLKNICDVKYNYLIDFGMIILSFIDKFMCFIYKRWLNRKTILNHLYGIIIFCSDDLLWLKKRLKNYLKL